MGGKKKVSWDREERAVRGHHGERKGGRSREARHLRRRGTVLRRGVLGAARRRCRRLGAPRPERDCVEVAADAPDKLADHRLAAPALAPSSATEAGLVEHRHILRTRLGNFRGARGAADDAVRGLSRDGLDDLAAKRLDLAFPSSLPADRLGEARAVDEPERTKTLPARQSGATPPGGAGRRVGAAGACASAVVAAATRASARGVGGPDSAAPRPAPRAPRHGVGGRPDGLCRLGRPRPLRGVERNDLRRRGELLGRKPAQGRRGRGRRAASAQGRVRGPARPADRRCRPHCGRSTRRRRRPKRADDGEADAEGPK